jgi:hypothetical protein
VGAYFLKGALRDEAQVFGISGLDQSGYPVWIVGMCTDRS